MNYFVETTDGDVYEIHSMAHCEFLGSGHHLSSVDSHVGISYRNIETWLERCIKWLAYLSEESKAQWQFVGDDCKINFNNARQVWEEEEWLDS